MTRLAWATAATIAALAAIGAHMCLQPRHWPDGIHNDLLDDGFTECRTCGWITTAPTFDDRLTAMMTHWGEQHG